MTASVCIRCEKEMITNNEEEIDDPLPSGISSASLYTTWPTIESQSGLEAALG